MPPRLALVVALVVLGSCGGSRESSPPPRPSWTVETVMFRDVYPESEGYSLGTVGPGVVVIRRKDEIVAKYVGVGGEVVKVSREE